MDRPKMICPDCGANMNHHAMKIDYSADDPSIVDPASVASCKKHIAVLNAGEVRCVKLDHDHVNNATNEHGLIQI